MKEIKEDRKTGEIPHIHAQENSIIKMSILINLIYRFNAISTKIQVSYFVDNDKVILVFIWKGERPRIANTILKNRVEGTDSTQFQNLL